MNKPPASVVKYYLQEVFLLYKKVILFLLLLTLSVPFTYADQVEIVEQVDVLLNQEVLTQGVGVIQDENGNTYVDVRVLQELLSNDSSVRFDDYMKILYLEGEQPQVQASRTATMTSQESVTETFEEPTKERFLLEEGEVYTFDNGTIELEYATRTSPYTLEEECVANVTIKLNPDVVMSGDLYSVYYIHEDERYNTPDARESYSSIGRTKLGDTFTTTISSYNRRELKLESAIVTFHDFAENIEFEIILKELSK